MKKKIFCVVLTILACLMTKAQTGNVGIGTANPGSKLTVNGSVAGAFTSVTANTYNAGENDFSMMWNGTANGTITLPASTTSPNRTGRLYFFKNASTAYTLTIDANGSELIDNNLTTEILPGESVLLTKTNDNTATGKTYMIMQLSKTQGYVYFMTGAVSQTIPGGTAGFFDLTTVEYSPNGGIDFDDAANEWVCPQTGLYRVTASGEGRTLGEDQSHCSLHIMKNGGFLDYLLFYLPLYATNSGTITQILNLAKGDRISMAGVPCYGCTTSVNFTAARLEVTRLQ